MNCGPRSIRFPAFGLLLAAVAAAQEPADPTAASGNLIRTLPLQPEKRSAISAAVERRDYTEAEQMLANEAKRDPKSQEILLVLANVLFLDGKHLNCAVVLKKAEKLGTLDERNRYLLALSYVTIGKGSWAIPELEKLAQAHPANANYPYWLARVAYKKMDMQSALAYAKKAIQLDPAFMRAHDQAGLCYDALGEPDAAIQSFQEAIRLNRDSALRSPWPALNLGVLYLRQGSLDAAEVSLRESIGIDSRFPIAHYRLGQVMEKKGKLDEAIAELDLAARLDPTYPEPHYALGRIYRQKKDMSAAEKELSLFQDLRRADQDKGITRSN